MAGIVDGGGASAPVFSKAFQNTRKPNLNPAVAVNSEKSRRIADIERRLLVMYGRAAAKPDLYNQKNKKFDKKVAKILNDLDVVLAEYNEKATAIDSDHKFIDSYDLDAVFQESSDAPATKLQNALDRLKSIKEEAILAKATIKEHEAHSSSEWMGVLFNVGMKGLSALWTMASNPQASSTDSMQFLTMVAGDIFREVREPLMAYFGLPNISNIPLIADQQAAVQQHLQNPENQQHMRQQFMHMLQNMPPQQLQQFMKLPFEQQQEFLQSMPPQLKNIFMERVAQISGAGGPAAGYGGIGGHSMAYGAPPIAAGA